MVAIGFFLVAVSRLAFGYFVLYPQEMFSIVDRLPGIVAIAGGVVIAIGWGRALGFPRGDLRAIGILGLIAGIAITMMASLSLLTTWFLYKWDFGLNLWTALEVSTCVLTLAGAFLWQRKKSTWLVLAGIAVVAHAASSFTFVGLDDDNVFLVFGVFPAVAWGLTGVAALAMRPGRAHVPSAVVVER